VRGFAVFIAKQNDMTRISGGSHEGRVKKPSPRQRTALSLDIATKGQVAIDTL